MAIVNIWYPKFKSLGQIKSGGRIDKSDLQGAAASLVENVGHASLTLDRAHSPDYVSWWPNEDHTGYATPNFAQDIRLEGRSPTTQVSLSGLDEASVQSWWQRVKFDGAAIPYRPQFLPADVKWTLDRNNCSHMVWMALKVGGSESLAKMLRFNADLVTPQQIHFYALRLKAATFLKTAL